MRRSKSSLVSVRVGGSIGVASAITPGAQLWAKRYNGLGNADDSASNV